MSKMVKVVVVMCTDELGQWRGVISAVFGVIEIVGLRRFISATSFGGALKY